MYIDILLQIRDMYECMTQSVRRCQLAVMFARELPDVKTPQVKRAPPNLLPITPFLDRPAGDLPELLLLQNFNRGGA